MQIKVEDFFNFFFSDDAISCTELFHKRCGDKGSLLGTPMKFLYSNVIFLVSLLKNMGQIFFHVFHVVNFVFLFRISVQFLVSSWKLWACPWCIISASNKSLFWYCLCVFGPSIFISAIYNNSFKCSVNYASVTHWLFLTKTCSISFSLSCIPACFSINILFCH